MAYFANFQIYVEMHIYLEYISNNLAGLRIVN